jgi:effector-binding domain-containing protein/uncharacterized protein YndB with AHSA1/START domain
MRLLKGLFVAVVILVVGLIGLGFVLPDEARLERSVLVDAPPATVYAALNGFHQFNKWSPWAELDPDAVYTREGPPVGVGAKQSWRSEQPSVGSGSQEIVEVVPFERIRMRLVFEGFNSENHASFILSPEGEGTRVVWDYETRFHGDLMSRYFGLMLDRMLGPSYERGLAAFRPLAESLPKRDISALQVEVMQVEPQPMIYQSAAAGPADASAILAAAYARLKAHLTASGLSEVAPPIAITRNYDTETGAWQFDAALVVDRADPPAAVEQGIQSGITYGGWVARAVHVGPSADSTATYEQLIAWRSAAGFDDNGDSWEQYVNDPGTTSAADLVTHIYWPIK